jgi:hypothetical protein
MVWTCFKNKSRQNSKSSEHKTEKKMSKIKIKMGANTFRREGGKTEGRKGEAQRKLRKRSSGKTDRWRGLDTRQPI